MVEFLIEKLHDPKAVASLLAILFPRRPLLGVPQHWGLQLWQLALLALIAGFLLLDWYVASVSAAVAGYWSWRLWPRHPKGEAEAGPLLRLICANLLYQNTDYDRILDSIAEIGADVVVLCEATMEARRRLRALEAPLSTLTPSRSRMASACAAGGASHANPMCTCCVCCSMCSEPRRGGCCAH